MVDIPAAAAQLLGETSPAQPQQDTAPGPAPAGPPADDGSVTVHFTDDGFTALGHVWLRGQELTAGPAHPRWDDIRTWIALTPAQQQARYGKVHFEPGPVPRQETEDEQNAAVEVRRGLGRRRSGLPDPGILENA